MLIDNYRHIHFYENCSANMLSVNFSIVVTSKKGIRHWDTLRGDMPPGRGPFGHFPGRRFHVAAKDIPQMAVKFLHINEF